jgi:hypothetical protein
MTKLYEDNKERAGYTITTTKKGLKLDMWSRYSNEPNYTFYVKETENFNRNTDFSNLWNDHMTYGEYFAEWVSEWVGTPDQNKHVYRVVA